MRSIPNITVLSPADSGETIKAVQSSIEYPTSTYIRLTGSQNQPIVYRKDYDFEIGKSVILKDGEDIGVFATGSMVSRALTAAEKLEEIGMSISVINMHTIKPIDQDVIRLSCQKFKLIVTVEEHNVIGGLGSAIAEFKSTLRISPPHLFIGLPDNYGPANHYDTILDENNLAPNLIANKISDYFQNL